jgi:hypothetical protein
VVGVVAVARSTHAQASIPHHVYADSWTTLHRASLIQENLQMADKYPPPSCIDSMPPDPQHYARLVINLWSHSLNDLLRASALLGATRTGGTTRRKSDTTSALHTPHSMHMHPVAQDRLKDCPCNIRRPHSSLCQYNYIADPYLPQRGTHPRLPIAPYWRPSIGMNMNAWS